MLIKAYIKREMFRLPMDQDKLQNQVKEAFKQEIEKSDIEKYYPLTKVEENENILVEKQQTNIFLLNLLLLVLNQRKTGFTNDFYCNEENIRTRLEEEIGLDKGARFEKVEKEVINFLNPSTSPETKNEVEKEGYSYLTNVQFSVGWLKGAQKELKQKDVKQKQDQEQKQKKKDNRRE